jgi:hypothetical protein
MAELYKNALCGATAILSASNGYNSYSGPQALLELLLVSTSQTYTATSTESITLALLLQWTTSIKEEINLILLETITNPVTRPTADQIVTCPNNGKDLPNIFFGATAATDRNQYYRCIFNRVAKLNEATVRLRLLHCANENFADSCWYSSNGSKLSGRTI